MAETRNDAIMSVLRGFSAQSEFGKPFDIAHDPRRSVARAAAAGRIAGRHLLWLQPTFRHREADGREYTTATVKEPEASIVRRNLRRVRRGARATTKIAKGLNDDRVPASERRHEAAARSHGRLRRSARYPATGSATSGIYVHGKVKRKARRAEKRVVTERKRDERHAHPRFPSGGSSTRRTWARPPRS